MAVGLDVCVAVTVGLSVAIGTVGADPHAVSALMIMVEKKKRTILFMAFLLEKTIPHTITVSTKLSVAYKIMMGKRRIKSLPVLQYATSHDILPFKKGV